MNSTVISILIKHVPYMACNGRMADWRTERRELARDEGYLAGGGFGGKSTAGDFRFPAIFWVTFGGKFKFKLPSESVEFLP